MLEHRKSICLVDDEKELVDSFLPFLKDKYDVRTFLSPVDALEAFDSGFRPDIVFSDVRMPEMSGFQMIEKMHTKNISPQIIVSSGHADKAVAIEALNLGANGFLEKPFTLKQFRAMLQHLESEAAAKLVQTNEHQEQVNDLLALNEIYFIRLSRAENFIFGRDLPYPETPELKFQYLEAVKQEAVLSKRINARKRKS